MSETAFVPADYRQTSPTSWDWPCGCQVRKVDGEMTMQPCSREHDAALERTLDAMMMSVDFR